MAATGASGGDDSEIEPLGTGRPLEMIKDIITHTGSRDGDGSRAIRAGSVVFGDLTGQLDSQ